jgi:hypothetical protein
VLQNEGFAARFFYDKKPAEISILLKILRENTLFRHNDAQMTKIFAAQAIQIFCFSEIYSFFTLNKLFSDV